MLLKFIENTAIPAENSDTSLIIQEDDEKSLRKSNLQHIDHKGKNALAGIAARIETLLLLSLWGQYDT